MKKQINPKTTKKIIAAVQGFYSLSEAAALAHVSTSTMHRLVTSGKVRAVQLTGPRGKLMIPQGNLSAFLTAAGN